MGSEMCIRDSSKARRYCHYSSRPRCQDHRVRQSESILLNQSIATTGTLLRRVLALRSTSRTIGIEAIHRRLVYHIAHTVIIIGRRYKRTEAGKAKGQACVCNCNKSFTRALPAHRRDTKPRRDDRDPGAAGFVYTSATHCVAGRRVYDRQPPSAARSIGSVAARRSA